MFVLRDFLRLLLAHFPKLIWAENGPLCLYVKRLAESSTVNNHSTGESAWIRTTANFASGGIFWQLASRSRPTLADRLRLIQPSGAGVLTRGSAPVF